MTREEIIENNKLIAAFMGYDNYVKPISSNGICVFNDHKGNRRVAPNYAEFNSSWNWLMPVVDKIERLGYGTRMDYHRASMYGVTIFVMKRGLINAIIHVAKQDSRLTSVYLAVVEFIKWYNKCQK